MLPWSLRPEVLGGLLLVGAVCAAYANTFSAPFVFDDLGTIVHNPNLEHPRTFGQIFLLPGDNGREIVSRPLILLSLALNQVISGQAVWSYHLFNLAVHAAAALVLFGLVRRWLRAPALAGRYADAADFLAGALALLWVLHPLQTQAVTYVIQRCESLAGLFILLTLYCLTRRSEGAGRGWLVAAGAFALAGAGCKETVIVLPVVVWLAEALLYERGGWRSFRRTPGLYLCLLPAMLAVFGLVVFGGALGANRALAKVDALTYLLTQPAVIGHYLRLVCWPQGLAIDYAWPWATPARALIPALWLGIGTLVTAVGVWRGCVWSFLPSLFLVLLAPSSSFFPLADAAYEHRVYLALAPVLAGALLGAWTLTNRWGANWGLGLAVFIWAGVLGGLTARRNHDYRSAEAIWTAALEVNPNNARAHTNLGAALDQLGRSEEAVAHYRQALRINPRAYQACNDLGLCSAKTGDNAAAAAWFQRALELKPGFLDARQNLALAWLRLGRTQAALPLFEAVQAARPQSAEAATNLANCRLRLGQAAAAAAGFEQALALEPDLAEAHLGLGNARRALGQADLAAEQYREAIRLAPKLAEAHNNLGGWYKQRGEAEAAQACYREALRLDSKLAEAWANLADLQARAGELAEARVSLETALRLKPELAAARYNYALLLMREGDRTEAISQLRLVLRGSPRFPAAQATLDQWLKAPPRPAGD